MIRKSTWIVFLVFVILLAVAIILNRTGTQLIKEPEPTLAPTQAALLDPASVGITAIRVESAIGPAFFAQLGENGTWTILEPPDSSITAGQIVETISSLTTMKILSSFAEPLALETVGLISPASKITLTTTDGRTRVINVGSLTPTGAGYYISVDNNPVVVVSKPALDPVLNLVVAPTPNPEGEAGTETLIPANP